MFDPVVTIPKGVELKLPKKKKTLRNSKTNAYDHLKTTSLKRFCKLKIVQGSANSMFAHANFRLFCENVQQHLLLKKS